MKQSGIDLLITTGGLSVDPDDITRQTLMECGLENIVHGIPVYPAPWAWSVKLKMDRKQLMYWVAPACALYFKTSLFWSCSAQNFFGGPKFLKRLDAANMAEGGYCLACKTCTWLKCGFCKNKFVSCMSDKMQIQIFNKNFTKNPGIKSTGGSPWNPPAGFQSWRGKLWKIWRRNLGLIEWVFRILHQSAWGADKCRDLKFFIIKGKNHPVQAYGARTFWRDHRVNNEICPMGSLYNGPCPTTNPFCLAGRRISPVGKFLWLPVLFVGEKMVPWKQHPWYYQIGWLLLLDVLYFFRKWLNTGYAITIYLQFITHAFIWNNTKKIIFISSLAASPDHTANFGNFVYCDIFIGGNIVENGFWRFSGWRHLQHRGLTASFMGQLRVPCFLQEALPIPIIAKRFPMLLSEHPQNPD